MSTQQLAIIDYGMGNLHSVAKAIEHVAPNFSVVVTSDKDIIGNADHVILPGVGAIRDCMAEIRQQQVDTVVQSTIESGKPLLGICVGMQALLKSSDENDGTDCLNHFDGDVQQFTKGLVDEQGLPLKVPHMGWNHVHQRVDHPLWHNIESGSRFYFVHSFYAQAKADYTAGSSHYGNEFAAMIYRDNIYATQFHPEKSHQAGLQLLKNFTQWNGQL
ncbi:imidazole glycerol phosphate synthase subunit HisH [Reinekea thalattae]|uniref:Imidazole glycerol phosphate synthase subunit HisH n=1 Tax=Reinekea thalattae TaxID=2593301 RepID=A0A5C8Z4F7_9GAMM|nr:imidazole glycerol phosphate synthase subunit HisH [Reinekea thalattae]TXR52078.1 imidazole glycerol phosphate synthase subunit HisH [Reinekea thalattae]